MDKSELNWVQFNGKNYFIRLFVKEKELWYHIDGTVDQSPDKEKSGKWETGNDKITSWITSSVDQQIVL